MKIYENGVIREMTPEEIAEMGEANDRYAAEEKHRPLTAAEVQDMMLRQQINTLAVDDATALRMLAFYPEWASGTAYTAENGCPVGYKVTRNGKLYKLRQSHISHKILFRNLLFNLSTTRCELFHLSLGDFSIYILIQMPKLVYSNQIEGIA